MSSFLRESIVIKSTAEITLEIHINLFLSQKKYKKLAFEMGIWVKQINKNNSQQNLQIIFPFATEGDNERKRGTPKIIDLSDKLWGKNNRFARLIFNEELKEKGDIFELNNNPISFQKITDKDLPIIKIENTQQGHYYRFRITDIAMDNLIVEQQCSSFIGDPIKRSIKTIGFHINNERNLGEQNIDDKDEIKNISFECINTFVVCNMGVDILDSMQEKRSFRVLEDHNVWGEYLNLNTDSSTDKCIDESEIPKAVVYQFKKENRNKKQSDKENFQDFKLFIRFLETESNPWNLLPTISAIITLAFAANTLYSFMDDLQCPYATIFCLIILAIITFCLFWRSRK